MAAIGRQFNDRRRQVNVMANHQPNTYGRSTRPAGRVNHLFGAPTIGRIFTGVFVQQASAETRTVEIVRYLGADVWKARIKETGSVFCRLGQQVEYASESAACADITEFFQRHGLRMVAQWEASIPEWSAAAVPAATRRPQIPGGVQQ